MTEQPQAHRPGSLKAALSNLGWLLGGRGVAALLSLVYLAIIARTLGPAGFGTFALVTGITQSVVAIVGFQTWQIAVRYGMAHLQSGDRPALVRLLKLCLLLDIGGAVAGTAISGVAIALLRRSFGWSPDLAWSAWVFSCVTLLTIRSTAIGILRLQDKFGAAATADTALPIGRMAGVALALLLAPTVKGYLAAYAAAECISSITFWIFVARHGGGWPWRATALDWPRVRDENDGIVRFSLITNGSQTFQLAAVQAPVLIVGFFTTPAAAGGFRLSHQIGRSLARGAQLFARALFPELMRVRASGSGAGEFGALLRRVTLGSALAGGLIVLVLLTAGRSLLGLIAGPEFLPAYPLLLLLGCAAVLELVGVGFEPALIASGRAGRSLRIQALGAAVTLTLMVAFVQAWGGIGAAWGVLIGSAFNFVRMAYAAWRATRSASPPEPEAATLLRGHEDDADGDAH